MTRFHRMGLPALLLLGLILVGAPDVADAKKPEFDPCVTFAATWDAAVAEAKLTNLPIVVHSHGFS